MGNRALNWAWSLNLPGPAKFVLLALADQAADETDSCFPGQQRLAEMVGSSLKTVERALVRLEELGLIERRQRRTKQGWRTSDLYVIHVGAALPDSLPTRQTAYQAEGLPDSPPTRHSVQAYPTLSPGLPDSLTGQEELRSSEPLVNPKGEPPDSRSTTTSIELEVPDEPPAVSEAALFDAWWREYPRKVSKPAARRAFTVALRKIGGPPAAAAAELTAAIREHRRHWIDLAGRSIEHMPHPATWLNAEAWADELPADDAYRARAPAPPRESSFDRVIRQHQEAVEQLAREEEPHGRQGSPRAALPMGGRRPA